MRTRGRHAAVEDDGPDLPWPVPRHLLGDPARLRRASPLQRVPAILVDVALHTVAALVITAEVADPDATVGYLLTLVASYLVVSFVHRVPLQWRWGATLGRALAGLCCADPRTGGPPTAERLVVGWLIGVRDTVAFLSH